MAISRGLRLAIAAEDMLYLWLDIMRHSLACVVSENLRFESTEPPRRLLNIEPVADLQAFQGQCRGLWEWIDDPTCPFESTIGEA